MAERAANCHSKAGDWYAAAILYRDQTVPRLPERAAECFLLCRHWHEAAAVWAGLGAREQALAACVKGAVWDLGIRLVTNWMVRAKVKEKNPKSLAWIF